jgi:hypothetical protein
MSFIHGKNAVIKITGAGGVTTDLSPFANEVDMPRSIDTAETSHFGSQSKTYLAGLDDSTVSIKGMYDPTADAAIAAAVEACLAGTIQTIDIEYGPGGSAVGAVKYTLSAIPTAYEVDAPVGDVVTFSLDMQRTGDTVRDVY